MLYHEQSDDYRPLFWVQGRPIYANTLIVLAHVAAFIVSALCISYFRFSAVSNALALDTERVWHGAQLWRLVSYVAFDPFFFTQRSLWFLFSIILLYFFGREVEQFVGRKTYLKFYAALIVIPAVLFCLVGRLLVPWAHPYLNCGDVIFGVFVAFATIYPGAMPAMWVPISARALMWILLAISSLIDLAFHYYPSIFMLWACAAVGYFAMRLVGAGHGANRLADWLETQRARRLARRHQFKVVQDKKTTESIDAILEKISKQGVGSLDARERATLEEARAKLLKRDQN
jgi:membrane associated rhomboid family serine protease